MSDRSHDLKSQGEHNAGVPFREHSMLSNPMAPSNFVKDRLEVTICKVSMAAQKTLQAKSDNYCQEYLTPIQTLRYSKIWHAI